MDIASWLRELGLERYERAFQQSEIEPEILAELTDADLKELGIPLGPRRKLAKAIAALSVETAPSGHPTPAVAPATPAPQAERRQLTVLFVDLVGSTALAARLDPEDMGAVMRAYHGACAETVERWGGHVAKYMGDGVLAYFGWPQAHEDDAERAVRAGLELVAAVSTLDATGLAVGGGRAKGQPLAARIGIATGLVMVGELIGEGSAKEQTVIGETPNLAARLQALAAPGSVVIGQATRKLVGALFELVDLGPRRLKGFTTPIAVWQVAGEGRAEGRFEALHGERLTPLVGREHELGILLERWAWARDGDGQVVLLAGEPGIGKSRLTQALYQRLAGESFVRLRYYCSPYYVNSAFYPIIDQLERAAGFRPEDTAETKLDKVETLFAKPSEDSADLVPLIANLLSIPTSSAFPPAKWSPTAQKMKTMELLISQLKSLAQQQAILVVFEDAHWIDPTTSEWIGLVIEHIQHLPVLLLMTFRPEYAPPWTSYPHVTSLTLSRLGQRQGAQMVERLTGNKPLPAEVFEQILLKTDGVPLFVEELTKTVLDSGLLSDAGDHFELSGPLPPLAIPATLHDSLMARLDRLASVKEVAQIGAVIGREFSHELLKAVAPLATRQLHDSLTELVASELVFRRGLLPDAVYYFKHALVRDAAYQSLLKISRQQYHQRIAQVLEDRFPRTAETEPEILAQHYSEAGLADEAIDYWHRAGQLAIQRSANVEAVIHCERALELISQIPETAARHERELQIQMTLGPASVAARGFADPAVGRAYARAWELCQRLEDKVRLPVVLRGRQVFHRIRGSWAKREVSRSSSWPWLNGSKTALCWWEAVTRWVRTCSRWAT